MNCNTTHYRANSSSVPGDPTLTFSTANGNAISISDADAGSNAMKVTLSVASGTLTLGGLTGLTVTGNGSSTVVVQGSQADINAALQGLIYQGNLNFNGGDSLTVLTSDLGNSGNGGTLTDSDSVAITVNAVNDAPVNTLPNITTAEDTSVKLAGLSVADVDVGAGAISVTLSVGAGNGTLTAADGGGVTVTGSGSNSLVLSGTLADINLYLATAASQPTYVPAGNANGSVTLTMTTSDNGFTGLGGAQTDVDTSTITITAVNDAPVNTLPASYTTTEDNTVALSGLSVSDVDAGSNNVTVTLNVNSGVIYMGSSFSVSTTGAGTDTVTITGTVAAVNAFLSSSGVQPTFSPAGNFNGPVTLTMTTSDNGFTGSGGTQVDTDVRTINVTAVNDSPYVVKEIDPQLFDEDTAVSFQVPADTFADPDGDTLSYTGAMADGSALPSWLTFDGTTRTFSGTPPLNFNGSLLVGVTASDGSLSATETFYITISPVNDNPVNTLPDTFSVANNGTLKLAGLSVSDVDAGAGNITVTLSVPAGTLAASSGSGVTVGGSGSGTLTLTGQLSSINTYLANSATQPTFTPTAAGTVTLTMTTTDNGNTGSGGALQDQDFSTISVTSGNVAPTANGDIIWVSNSTTGTLSNEVLLANDTDPDGLALTVTNIVVSGTTGGATGSVTLNANGTFTFSTGAIGGSTSPLPPSITLTYTTSDGAGGTTTGTVTLRVVNTDGGVDTISLVGVGAYQASYIDGRAGADNLTDGAGLAQFIGGDGADTLTGNAGNDLLIGGDNNDTLSGGDGNDTLRGGIGNNDSMDGGNGSEDLLDFSDGTAAITFTLVQSTSTTSIANATGGLGNNDTYQNMEGVIGTNNALGDNITGSGNNDVIRGGVGNDILNGAGGTGDLLDLSDATGGFTINFSQGVGQSVTASGIGTDTYSNFEGVVGSAFADTINGSAGNDILRGGAGNDIINGGLGNDLITGGTGADTLTGGGGSDLFVFNSPLNNVDQITDFDANGMDQIHLENDVFTMLTTTGVLSGSNFAANAGGVAGDANDYVLFDTTTGNLYYDADGSGAGQRMLIATLTLTAGTLDPTDIRII